MIKIGDKVIFDCLNGIRIFGMAYGNKVVAGEVIEVHEDHRWFGVKYKINETTTLRTSFNFADIGNNVILCK